MAITRVSQRAKEGGHIVDENTIRFRYKQGLVNLDNNFDSYDKFMLFESLPNYDAALSVVFDQTGISGLRKPSFFSKIPRIAHLLEEQG